MSYHICETKTKHLGNHSGLNWTKEAYQGCARLSHSRQWALWYIRPKCHNMAHVVCHARTWILTVMTCVQKCHDEFSLSNMHDVFSSQLRRDVEYQLLAGARYIFNPASQGPNKNQYHWPPRNGLKFSRPGLATWTDEDYIGRVARVGRKVHNLNLPMSTIKRCLIAYKREWRKSNPRDWVSGLVTSRIFVERKSVCVRCMMYALFTPRPLQWFQQGLKRTLFFEGFQTSTFFPNERKFEGANKCVTMEGLGIYTNVCK